MRRKVKKREKKRILLMGTSFGAGLFYVSLEAKERIISGNIGLQKSLAAS